MRSLLRSSLFIVLFTSACASSSHSTGPHRLATVDCELHFWRGTSFPPIRSVEYSISSNAVIIQTTEDDTRRWQPKRSATRHITDQGWKQCQMSLNKLDVFHWKPKYSPPHKTYDGGAWGLSVTEGKRSVNSGGANAGPSPSNPRITITGFGHIESADKLLRDALEELWNHSTR